MFFVCRWRESSPFSKRVVRLPDATVLDWFRDLARRLRAADDHERWPYDAPLLGALADPDDDDLGPALRRYTRLPGYDPVRRRREPAVT
jgi:hypothetical protein